MLSLRPLLHAHKRSSTRLNRSAQQEAHATQMASNCSDQGPWRCIEAGCPKAQVSCADLRPACRHLFSAVWSALPNASLGGLLVWQACGRTCGRCGASPVRGSEGQAHPAQEGLTQLTLAAFVRWTCRRADAALATATRDALHGGRVLNFSIVLRALDNRHVVRLGSQPPPVLGWMGLPVLPELASQSARHEFQCKV